MSLFLATLLTALILLAFGLHFLFGSEKVAKTLPRHPVATFVLMGVATVWFLYRVAHLGAADFGQFRTWLFLGFAAVAVLSFFWAPDFLAVRGFAALLLLGGDAVLAAAYMQYQLPQRLVLVSFVYFAIVLAIYLAASPFRLRDFLNWLYKVKQRARVLGGALAGYGLLLAAIAFTYPGA